VPGEPVAVGGVEELDRVEDGTARPADSPIQTAPKPPTRLAAM